MKIGDIMTTDVVTVDPATPYKDVVERLVRAEVGSLPVVDQGGGLLGVITEADLLSKEAYGTRHRRAVALLVDLLSGRDHHWVTKASGLVAAQIMTTDVVTCRPDDEVRAVARRMLARTVTHMPVLRDRRVVGIVSRRDLLRIFDRPDEVLAVDVQRLLANDLTMPEGRHVSADVEGGVVTLTGDVCHEWDEAVVVSLVGEVDGVIDVVSRLHHREPNPRLSTEPWMFGAR